MLWIETPTNPLVKYVDIEEASKAAHKYNLKVVVDNTFLSPYFQVENYSKLFTRTERLWIGIQT